MLPGFEEHRQTELQVTESGTWDLRPLAGEKLDRFKDNLRKWWNATVCDQAFDELEAELHEYGMSKTADLMCQYKASTRKLCCCGIDSIREMGVVSWYDTNWYDKILVQQEHQLQCIIQRIRSNDPDLQDDLDKNRIIWLTTADMEKGPDWCDLLWSSDQTGGDISDCESLRDSSLREIGIALHHNTCLQTLNLQYTRGLTEYGILDLLPGIQSSRVFRVGLSGNDLGRFDFSRRILAQLQSVLVQNLLERLQANDSTVTRVNVRETWMDGFDDSGLEQLVSALRSNTHLAELRFPPCDNQGCCMNYFGFSYNRDRILSSLQPLADAMNEGAAAGLTSVHLPDGTTNWSSLSTVVTNMRAGAGAITRKCVANAIRRLSQNDPLLTQLEAPKPTPLGWTAADLDNLEIALVGNSHLVKLDLSRLDQSHLTWERIYKLAATIPRCAIRDVDLGWPYPEDEELSLKRTQMQRLLCQVCEPKQKDHSAMEESLRTQRPYQRLLLAALHNYTAAALSTDLLTCIVAYLNRSEQCPYVCTGARSEAVPLFMWHCSQLGRVARWSARELLPQSSNTTSYTTFWTSSRGTKPQKRRKTDQA